MTLISVGEVLAETPIVQPKSIWTKCPFCGDEVTRLRPCVYYTETTQVGYICVECAESVKGLTYMAINYPIPGAQVTRELMPLYKKLATKYINEHSYKALVDYGDWGFMVWPRGGKMFALEKGKTPDQEKVYDNTFQVWFALQKHFRDGKTEDTPIIPRKSERRSKWSV